MSTPYIAMYPSDYLADTAHLGLTEHGVYWRMLLHYYQHCKPFPNDLDRINRLILATTPEEKRVTEYILGEFFILHKHEDSCFYWHNARADFEIAQAESKHNSAVAKGKKGGRPKKAEVLFSLSSAKVQPKQPEPEPEPEKENTKTVGFSVPTQEILDLYHSILFECPKVLKLTKPRESSLKSRWNEDNDRQSIDWWKEYFDAVSRSSFLTGKSTDFKATFDWIINPTNMIKVLEGNYADKIEKSNDQVYGGYI